MDTLGTTCLVFSIVVLIASLILNRRIEAWGARRQLARGHEPRTVNTRLLNGLGVFVLALGLIILASDYLL